MKLCRCGRIVKESCSVCNPPPKHALTTSERGYSSDHKRASELYRTLHPLCENCVCVSGVIDANPSEEMHHIESIASNPGKRMSRDNWLAVCKSCHQELEGDVAKGKQVKRWSESNYEDALNG